jgi:hypothetical protein
MEVGVTFLILGGCYMATTPIVGYVSFSHEFLGRTFHKSSNLCSALLIF